MKKGLKQGISVLLTSAMALSMISMTAFADTDITEVTDESTEITEEAVVAEVEEQQPETAEGGRIVESLDGEWSFIDIDGNETTVTVPHSWEYTNMSAYSPAGSIKTCTYTRTVDVSGYEGKELFVKFEAVNKVAKVYVDGEQVGYHNGGFTAFAVDITDAAAGKESIELKVETTNISLDTMPANTDFTHFAGIYRDVELVAVDKRAYISLEDYGSDGVYVETSVDLENNVAYIDPTVMMSYEAMDGYSVMLESVLKDADGNVVDSDEYLATRSTGATADEVYLSLEVEDPHLWQGTDDPYLYTLETTISIGDEILDTNTQKVGLRTFEVKDGEFYLNGELYELRGVGMHQEYGGETNAVSDEQREEDIDTILEMGANALRTCHYPHDQYTYELCDEKGIVVWNEIPFYLLMLDTETFRQNVVDSVTEMVKQGMNHPSIIVWGIENEVNYYSSYAAYYQQPSVEELGEFMQELAETVKTIDPTRLVGEAEIDNSEYSDQTASWTTADSDIDVVGFNIYTGWYSRVYGATEANKLNRIVDAFKSSIANYQNKFNTASEGTASYVLTEYGAGANVEQHDELGESFLWGGKSGEGYQTGGQYHPEEYQSYVHEGMIMALYGDETNNIEPAEGLWAAFAWSMFDFSCFRNEGGTTRTNTKGLITADRQTKKDAFYLYKANWNDTDYFTHICSSRFTDRSSKKIDVKVYSNCDSVELIVNGESIGEGTLAQDGVFVWEGVKLNDAGESNEVEAIGFKNGAEYADTCDTWVYNGNHSFDDVSEDSYYADAVNWAYEENITTGTTDKTFSPYNTATRCEFVTFLWRAAGCPEPETTENPFTDVKEGSYYYKAVLWAYENGITTGTSATTFDPKKTCSRGEVVTFLWRYAGKPEVSDIENPFTDVTEGKFYYKAVLWAYKNNITTGTGTTFNPSANCQRCQVVTFLYRALVLNVPVYGY